MQRISMKIGAAAALALLIMSFVNIVDVHNNGAHNYAPHTPQNQTLHSQIHRPPKCTPEQRTEILKQLTPDRCNKTFEPYFQKCSFTQATKCPDSTWIDSHYESIHSKGETITPGFVAVYVGCNKGYDAVNALRMGTRNSKYNKGAWATELKESHESVCNQNKASEFPIVESESGGSILDGTVHCIEPVKNMVERLKQSAKSLGWEDNFLVTEAAIAKEVGVQYFLGGGEVGIEKRGIDDCKGMKAKEPDAFKKLCIEVPLYSLDYYMETIAEKKDGGRIHVLSIDVEGYDFDVLLGANHTLTRTEYLEFEYNWMGSWAKQNLIDAVKMLDDVGFTCYWAGIGKAWRIDESCWLDHFSWHSWSNVACVNRLLNQQVARNMEETFMKTLKENVEY